MATWVTHIQAAGTRKDLMAIEFYPKYLSIFTEKTYAT